MKSAVEGEGGKGLSGPASKKITFFWAPHYQSDQKVF